MSRNNKSIFCTRMDEYDGIIKEPKGSFLIWLANKNDISWLTNRVSVS